MQIIATLSLKGGVGKTTIAMHLATVIAEHHALVTVLDADEEVSALRWQQHALADGVRLPFSVIPADRNSFMRQAKDLARAGHIVVIDTPPNNREVLKSAATIADVVLVPVLPTGLDVDRLGTTLDLLRDLEAALDEFNYAVVLNRYDARKGMAKEANQALDNLPRLTTVIRALASYEKAFGHIPSDLVQFREIWNELTGSTVPAEVVP
ncbi:ParA family protein [Deinococcus ruber]|uniref:ParA family protein n=1 Tax=Deinococcus ruber TaxID=1848197 RepID=UPI001E2E3D54|nr:ParA family protein [Deinococcus ruber]